MVNLYLYDTDMKQYVNHLAKAAGQAGAIKKGINSWAQLKLEIGRRKSIDTLTLDTHAFPGGMLINGVGKSFSQPYVKNLFLKVKTKIKRIIFEGCNVAESPNEMAVFGKLFNAKIVAGFTWECATGFVTISIPKGTNIREMSQSLAHIKKWMVGTNIPSLVAKARRRSYETKIFCLYYVYGTRGYPWIDNNAKRTPMYYKLRSDATIKNINASAAKKTTSTNPPFERIIVKL